MLKAGAKKEAKLTWYTSLTAHRDIANVFEAKYPGVKVETYRAGPPISAGGYSPRRNPTRIADLAETTPTTMMIMRDNKLLMPYTSPHLANYPEDSKEEADKTRVLDHRSRTIVGLQPQHDARRRSAEKFRRNGEAGKQRQDRRQWRHHRRALYRRDDRRQGRRVRQAAAQLGD
jgi:hypothetical protein